MDLRPATPASGVGTIASDAVEQSLKGKIKTRKRLADKVHVVVYWFIRYNVAEAAVETPRDLGRHLL